MQSKATTVQAYLASLPEDRRAALQAIRAVILKNLGKGFVEAMQYGMIGYVVPHSIFPDGYHCDPKQPLTFAGLASQKNYMSLYLMCVYGDAAHAEEFRRDWLATGKKLDMGKSCIRFKRLEDVALDAVAQSIRRVTVKGYVDSYVKIRDRAGTTAPARANRAASAANRVKSSVKPAAATKKAKPRSSGR